jgi:hypothetical protein
LEPELIYLNIFSTWKHVNSVVLTTRVTKVVKHIPVVDHLQVTLRAHLGRKVAHVLVPLLVEKVDLHTKAFRKEIVTHALIAQIERKDLDTAHITEARALQDLVTQTIEEADLHTRTTTEKVIIALVNRVISTKHLEKPPLHTKSMEIEKKDQALRAMLLERVDSANHTEYLQIEVEEEDIVDLVVQRSVTINILQKLLLIVSQYPCIVKM